VTEVTKPDSKLIAGLKDGPDRIALFHEVMDRVHVAVGGVEQAQSQDDGAQSQSQQQGAAAKPDDFAHGFVAALRGLGIPARHVTGYLLDDGRCRFHAWGEAWDDRLGWIGFDPTNDLLVENDHIILGVGRDFSDVSPVDGIIVGSPKQKLSVAVDVMLVE